MRPGMKGSGHDEAKLNCSSGNRGKMKDNSNVLKS